MKKYIACLILLLVMAGSLVACNNNVATNTLDKASFVKADGDAQLCKFWFDEKYVGKKWQITVSVEHNKPQYLNSSYGSYYAQFLKTPSGDATYSVVPNTYIYFWVTVYPFLNSPGSYQAVTIKFEEELLIDNESVYVLLDTFIIAAKKLAKSSTD